MAGTKEALLMVEAGAHEVDEDTMNKALSFAHEAMQPLIDAQLKLAEAVGKPKKEYPSFAIAEEIKEKVLAHTKDSLTAIYEQGLKKHDRNTAVNALRKETIEALCC